MRRALAVLDLGSTGRLVVGSMHLSLNPEARIGQIQSVDALFDRFRHTPIIIGGDLNESPDGLTVAQLSSRWRLADPANNVATYPAWSPNRKLDYLLYRPAESMRIISVAAGSYSGVSDHLPLRAEMEIGAESSS